MIQLSPPPPATTQGIDWPNIIATLVGGVIAAVAGLAAAIGQANHSDALRRRSLAEVGFTEFERILKGMQARPDPAAWRTAVHRVSHLVAPRVPDLIELDPRLLSLHLAFEADAGDLESLSSAFVQMHGQHASNAEAIARNGHSPATLVQQREFEDRMPKLRTEFDATRRRLITTVEVIVDRLYIAAQARTLTLREKTTIRRRT
jgi:hypothetical protein